MFKKYFPGILAIIIFISSVTVFLDSSDFLNPGPKKRKSRFGKPSGAMQSLQFYSEVRAFPDKDIPADKFYKAFEYSQNNLADVFDNPSAQQWTSIGPNNIGGRSISLAVHPVDTAVVFIGSASGGLWKSTTGGL